MILEKNIVLETNKNILIDKMPPNFFWIGFIKLYFQIQKLFI